MQSTPNTNREGSYRFGPFLLDVAGSSLYRDGEFVPLTPKVFDTLLALISENGRTLTKNELIERVWPDAAVGDGSLAQNILVLRKILDPCFPGEGPIVTFPKRGYRFTAPVEFLPKDAVPTPTPTSAPSPAVIAPATPTVRRTRFRLFFVSATLLLALVIFFGIRTGTLARPTPKRRSVAVLALKNLSAKRDSDWYSTALAETLTGELRAGGDLRTIPSDNVRRMQQELPLPGAVITRTQISDIRNDLGCDLVLSGSYLTVGDKIRVELLLSDAVSGETVTSISDTDNQDHLLELVSRSGERLRAKLGVHPLETTQARTLQHEVSSNPEASRFYFEGLAALKLSDGPAAEKQLTRAIQADPGFALAHSALSSTWHDLGYNARALQEAKIAMDLAGQGQSREDHLAMEAQYYESLFDWNKAAETYRSLWRFFPDNMEYGLKLARVQYAAGQPAEALKTVTRLRNQPAPDNQDPRIDLLESTGVQLSGDYQRAYETASQAARKAEAVKARILLAQARLRQGLDANRLGRPEEARHHLADAKELFEAVGDFGFAADALQSDADILRAQGQMQASLAELETALAMSRKVGFTRMTNRILAAYSNILLDIGSLDAARKACEEAIASNGEINDVGVSFSALMDRGRISKAQGRYTDARADFVESARIAKQAGYRLEATNAGTSLGLIDAALGRLPDARRELDETVLQKRQLGNRSSLAASLGALATVERVQGDLAGARRLTEEQCGILESLRERSNLAGCRVALAELLLDDGRGQEARAAVGKLLSEFTPDSFGPVELGNLAMLRFATGDARGARESLSLAERKLKPLGTIPDRSLPVALVAARVAKSVPQLKGVAGEAAKLDLVPVALEARLALLELSPRASQPTEAGRLALDAEQKGFVLIAQKARLLVQSTH